MNFSFRHLNPGGWLEIQDMKFPIMCDDGTLDDQSMLRKWSSNQIEAFDKIGKRITLADQYKDFMVEAGFKDVKEVLYKWPINPWPKQAKEKKLGLWEQRNFLDGLAGFTLATHTRILEWSMEEIQVLMAGVRREISDKSIHAYLAMYV